MEILDVYDDFMKPLNKIVIRGSKLNDGENIMLAIVFIKNKNGEYLIQKTSKEKGEVYATTGGHVIHAEDEVTTIIREVKEELGISIEKENLRHIVTFKYPTKPCIFTVYLLDNVDIDIKHLTLQKEEVEGVYWMNKEKIKELIKENLFLESHGFIFENGLKWR